MAQTGPFLWEMLKTPPRFAPLPPPVLRQPQAPQDLQSKGHGVQKQPEGVSQAQLRAAALPDTPGGVHERSTSSSHTHKNSPLTSCQKDDKCSREHQVPLAPAQRAWEDDELLKSSDWREVETPRWLLTAGAGQAAPN